jgi:hypothetical protein
VTLEDFERQVAEACAASPIVAGISVVNAGLTWITLRAHLMDGTFVDAFFNEATGRTAFALIADDKRIFGADNTDRWHWHPFAAPESHVPASGPIAFQDFLKEIETQRHPDG